METILDVCLYYCQRIMTAYGNNYKMYVHNTAKESRQPMETI